MEFVHRILFKLLIIQIIFSVSSSYAANNGLKIRIEIQNNSSLKSKLINVASNIEKMAKKNENFNSLEYWSSEAKKELLKLLYSEGYYAAKLNKKIIRANENQKYNKIIFEVFPDERYRVVNIELQHAKGSNQSVSLPSIKELGLESGQYAIAQKLLDVESKIYNLIEQSNCLLNIIVTHQAVLNNIDKVVDMTYIINSGPEASFGQIHYEGLNKVKISYVNKVVNFKEGQCFKQSYIHQVRDRLQQTRLFVITRIDIPKVIDKDGSVPVTFKLTEGQARTVKAGVSYSTDLGAGINLGWEHRNLFGNGEDLNINTFYNRKDKIFEVNYVKPYYIRLDQELHLNYKYAEEHTKAYDSKENSISGFIERKLTNIWSGGIGNKLSKSIIKKDGTTKNFLLFSIPTYLTLDNRDNVLNSTKGYRMKAIVTPFFSLRKENESFLKMQITGVKYWSFDTSAGPTIAVRAGYGLIKGSKPERIPDTEKFYVGGIQTLRGYKYQFAGELDSNKNPIGGQSMFLASIEVRFNLNDDFGFVSFIDSGRSYLKKTPDFKKPLFYGVGFGLRYITIIGPIRADIAFPMKRRKSIDKGFQIYLGIGQSF